MRDDARATRGRDVRRARDDDDGGRATGVRGETDVRCGARARGGVRGRGARGGGTRVRARGERGGVDERDDERRDDECDECDAGDARDEEAHAPLHVNGARLCASSIHETLHAACAFRILAPLLSQTDPATAKTLSEKTSLTGVLKRFWR